MACACYYNPSLCTYTTIAQTISAGGEVAFNINKVHTGTAIQHTASSTTITISKAGVYFVSLDLDVEPNATGSVTVQINNNDVVIPDAITTFAGTADDATHIHLDTLVRVMPSCCAVDNTVNLTANVSVGSTVTNAKMIVL